MIKLKDILKESAPGFENRQFGDPLPTLADVAKEYQEKNGIQVEEGQKREASNIINKFDKAYLNFAKEVRDVIKMVNRSTGEKTDGKIIDKSYSKHLIQLDKLMQSWSRGQQENPNIDESVNEAKYKGYDWKRQNRKDGHPLIVPALQKTFANMKDLKKYIDKHGTMESVNEEKQIFKNIYLQFTVAVQDFNDRCIEIADKITDLKGDKTDGKILMTNVKKHLIPIVKLMNSWNKGQQKNPNLTTEGKYHDYRNDDTMTPNIDESVNEKVASPFSNHLRNAQEEIEWMIGEHNDAEGEGVYDKPKEAMKLLQIAQKSLGKIK